jgi:hypothetical protein
VNPTIILALLGLIDLAGRLVPQLITILQQQGELTDEQAAEYKAKFKAALAADYWQPDVPAGG